MSCSVIGIWKGVVQMDAPCGVPRLPTTATKLSPQREKGSQPEFTLRIPSHATGFGPLRLAIPRLQQSCQVVKVMKRYLYIYITYIDANAWQSVKKSEESFQMNKGQMPGADHYLRHQSQHQVLQLLAECCQPSP